MLIQRQSMLTGKLNEMDLPISIEELNAFLNRGPRGALVQDMFPQLSAIEREFLLTGSTEAEWKEAFGDDIDEEEML